MNKNIDEIIKEDINQKEKIVKYYYIYNIETVFKHIFLKFGIVLDYLFPYIMAYIITLNLGSFRGTLPLISDNIKYKMCMEKIYQKDFDVPTINYGNKIKYDCTTLIYSTEWKLNEDEVYERKEIFYTLNKEILKQLKIDDILNMCREELQGIFAVYDYKIITSNNMDNNFTNSFITVVTHEDISLIRKGTNEELYHNNSMFLFLIILEAFGINKINKIIFKNYFRDKLREYDTEPIIYTKDFLNEIQMAIDIQKANLNYINDYRSTNKIKMKGGKDGKNII